MSTKMMSPEDQLREYLAQDLALTKLRLNESQRSMGKLFYLVMLLVFLFIICIAGFACSVIFVSKEHTKQIEALLGSGMEITTTIRPVCQVISQTPKRFAANFEYKSSALGLVRP